VRTAVLSTALVFIASLAVLTVRDLVRHGVTAVGVLAALIVALFAIGIVGVVRHPPSN
jgi:hypothetical protein